MFDWITGLVEDGGLWGVALLMFLENVFPPTPSEVIMPLAGYAAAQGQIDLWGAVAAGSLGSLAGTSVWYALGCWVGTPRLKRWTARHGRWLTLTPAEVDRASDWFERRGPWAVFLGRLVPAVRTLISVPAGMARMPPGRFLLFTGLGTAIWTALLALAGYLLGSRYEAVSDWMGPVSNVVVGAVLLWYLYRVATFGKEG